jgi:hypothetical protein
LTFGAMHAKNGYLYAGITATAAKIDKPPKI